MDRVYFRKSNFKIHHLAFISRLNTLFFRKIHLHHSLSILIHEQYYW